jgi:hypothetical protein
MSAQSSISKVFRDILDLVELQVQLLSVDAQQAKRLCGRATTFGAVAAVLLLPVITTLLVGAGLLIAELTQLSPGSALLIVAACVGVVMGVLAVIAIKALQRAASSMDESKLELVENLKWLKATMLNPNTSPRNRVRSESFEFPPYASSVSSSIRGDRGWRSEFPEEHPGSVS